MVFVSHFEKSACMGGNGVPPLNGTSVTISSNEFDIVPISLLLLCNIL